MGAIIAVPWWVRWLAVIGVLVAAAGFGAAEMHKYDGARYDALQVSFASFRADVTAQGVVAKRAADAQDARQQEVTNALRANLALANGNYDAAARGLLQRPPARPDGSAVPVTACHPQDAAGSASGESVPLAEYRALEARALYDVQSLDLLRDLLARLAAAGGIVIQ